MFDDMMHEVHVNEKWFYMTKVERYYLYKGKVLSLCSCKSKRFIENIMFMGVIVRPRSDSHRQRRMFDGKIGLWPFVKKELAKRNSKNLKAGILVTVPIILTKEEYRKMFFE